MNLMDKKLLSLASTGFLFLSSASMVFAQVDVQVKPPNQGVAPSTGVSNVLSNALTIIFVAAVLVVLFFLVLGAFNWITSGGDKDKVGKARGIIVNALVGLAILALSLLIVTVAGQILHIDILKIQSIPSLSNQCPAGKVYDPTASGTGNHCVDAPQ